MKLIRIAALCAASLCSFWPSLSSYAANISPDVYVVMFRADWCGPCKIVEPNLNRALRSLSDPSIEYVTIDISGPSQSEVSAHRAFDRQIVSQYNGWMGVTGFAAIIDADTKQTLGCLNMTYKPEDMMAHISSLANMARANQMPMNLTCPNSQ